MTAGINFRKLMSREIGIEAPEGYQRWLRNFGQLDKWELCFTIPVIRPNTGAKV
jgi:hypothetical protein